MQVTTRNGRVAVTVGDHLPLFGHLDASGQGTYRRRENGAMGRTATAPNAPTTPVKQFERDAVCSARLRERFLGRIQAPIGRQIATVFEQLLESLSRKEVAPIREYS